MISYRLIINEIFLDIGDRYIQSTNLISIHWGVSSFSAVRARFFLVVRRSGDVLLLKKRASKQVDLFLKWTLENDRRLVQEDNRF